MNVDFNEIGMCFGCQFYALIMGKFYCKRINDFIDDMIPMQYCELRKEVV